MKNKSEELNEAVAHMDIAHVNIQNPQCSRNNDVNNLISIGNNELNVQRLIDTSSVNDISLLVNNSDLSLQEKLEFMNKIWFQLNWLQKWKWLTYSNILNGAFCKFCVIFSQKEGGIGKQSLGSLCTKEFSNWKHAIEKFKHHEETCYHKACIENYKVMSQKSYVPVNTQLDKVAVAEMIENRKLIRPVIESILVCGRQGLALRGHKDSGPLSIEEEPIENDGNFRAILRYGLKMASLGNSDLQLIRERCKRNAQYLSPKIQNEIIYTCNKLILERIVKRINLSKGFCVLADETADIGGIEQFSICARYIYNDEIQEDFLNFVPLHNTSGENLANTLLDSLKNFGIDLQYLRGQGYDGAAAMSGRFNGVQAIVKKQYKTAVYIHCSAHVLNLAICSACELSSIRNTIGIIEAVYNFMNTPKRQCVLQNEVKTVISSLEVMSGWIDRETFTKASQLLLSLRDTTFNVKKNIDLLEAINLAEDLSNEIQTMRQNTDAVFSVIFKNLEEKSECLDIQICIPRTYFYKDSDSLSEPDIVITEIKMWKNVLKRTEEDQKPKTVIQFLQFCDEDLFPNIYKLIKIICILPVTTCTSERSFSSLRNLKTYLRNTVSEDRLNGLAMLNIHRNEILTPDDIIEELVDGLRGSNEISSIIFSYLKSVDERSPIIQDIALYCDSCPGQIKTIN
ncbi:zinc finger MYM-type protein 1-like [Aphis gossypii]|uniref:zinc finger MYM-type protein 1-like n=1 Tax=Aphis gossypii TaxID=80765 RepID=UPI002159767C|nr:zinc finger MYM-type protein 1-like [Aphis gossypii]